MKKGKFMQEFLQGVSSFRSSPVLAHPRRELRDREPRGQQDWTNFEVESRSFKKL